MEQWRYTLRRLDKAAPGREQWAPDGTRLRQFVSAVTGYHPSAADAPWSELRIDRFQMPTIAEDGRLDLIWLPERTSPGEGQETVGRMYPVGPSVIGVAAVSDPETATQAQLFAGSPPIAEVSMITRSAVRLTRKIETETRVTTVDVLYPSEDLIMRSLINDWNAVASSGAPQGADAGCCAMSVPDDVEQRLRTGTVVSGCSKLAGHSYVVKRDDEGQPIFRQGITGGWRLRLLSTDTADLRWFATLMRFAEIAGLGRDHRLGMGRVEVAATIGKKAATSTSARTGNGSMMQRTA